MYGLIYWENQFVLQFVHLDADARVSHLDASTESQALFSFNG